MECKLDNKENIVNKRFIVLSFHTQRKLISRWCLYGEINLSVLI